MTSGHLKTYLRRIDRSHYPEVQAYSRDEIYSDHLAPGGLYLASRMTRSMNLKESDIVLDLGCGKAVSSIFLAKHFGVNVFSVDLWISATDLNKKVAERGLRHRIIPLRLDVTRGLPFAEDYFDAIFCMQAFHSFGGSVAFLRHLLTHLKPGGRLCVGGTCFNEETPGDDLPEIYHKTNGWDAEYSKYHSSEWWRALFIKSGWVDVIECYELEDGQIMWEDEVLFTGERAKWSDAYYQRGKWLIDQILHGRENRPYLTHFIATVEKKKKTQHKIIM